MLKLPISLVSTSKMSDLERSLTDDAVHSLGHPWKAESNSPEPPETATFEPISTDEEEILENESLSHEEKSLKLQKLLFLAASNGDVAKVHTLLGGEAKNYISLDAKDDSGSTALIYSSCFGNEAIVSELLRFGALPDIQDSQEWTALMWAINNHNLPIVRSLMENGASVELKTSTGRSALDFITPNSEISKYMRQNGFIDSDEPNDFYDDGADPNRHIAEEMFSRDYTEESASAALGIQVSMSHLDLNESPSMFNDDDDENYVDDHEEFVWERCLPDQMFVFNESDIPKILDLAITKMQPMRSRSQKPVPANIVFLSARYAHYYGNPETLEMFLEPVLSRIRSVIAQNDRDMSFLGFWLSNCALLLYYMRKDPGLMAVTLAFQEQLSELISDIYILITQDAELRIEGVLDASILDYETIPGLNNILYQADWKIFRHKIKPMSHKQEVDQVTKPPSPKRKAKPSPRNVTSILSAVLFVMDLYGVHPIITQQIISQILYWLGAVLFNRIISSRKYLARSRAMQVRLNVSAIEDWARSNNRRPEKSSEFETNNYPSTLELCRTHLEPLVQLLQWLQCFTGLGDDFTNVVATLQQLTKLNPLQLLNVANKYRAEVGEKGLSKDYKQYLSQMVKHYQKQHVHRAILDPPTTESRQEQKIEKGSSTENVDDKTSIEKDQSDPAPATPSTSSTPSVALDTSPQQPVKPTIIGPQDHDDEDRLEIYQDASQVLPFVIPTLREMIVSYGAGLGGTNLKRARRYEPSLPTEFLDQFETEDEEATATNNTINPIFRDVPAPQPSVHKGWGEDAELDAMNGGWS